MSWDYKFSEEAVLDFNESSKEEQLKILKKWYPIGMSGMLTYWNSTKIYESKKEFEIKGYSLNGNIYNVVAEKILYEGKKYVEEKKIHPMLFMPSDSWKRKTGRDDKLNDLLDD
jgi:hypothetical protein